MLPQVFLSDAWYWVFRSMGMGLMKLELLDYRHIIALDSLQSCWDSAAQVPYMVNSQGHVVVNYENAQSIAFKCQFLHQKGMLGAMYWDYDSDDEKGTLRHAVYQGVMNP